MLHYKLLCWEQADCLKKSQEQQEAIGSCGVAVCPSP